MFLALALAVGGRGAAAQSTAPAVADAERLRNERRFAEAVRVLEAHLIAVPDDADASRLLAQTLYWMQDVPRARATYERALRQHPDDVGLRLEFGRMLLETGDRRRARDLLAPLTGAPEGRAEASALLGTLAYWEGDFTAARRLFLDAIASGSSDPQVVRHLADIRIVSAPWVRLTPSLFSDDQPLDRTGGRLDAGWFLTPIVPVEVRADWSRYRTEDDEWQTIGRGDVRLAAYLPAARLDVETAFGLVQRSEPIGRQWTGHVGGGFRLGAGFSIGGRLERDVYLRTASSLERDVTVTTARAGVEIDNPHGWTGNAALERHEFFDGNIVRSASAWLLAPFVHRPAFGLQLGYALAASDADEPRFVLPAAHRQRLFQMPPTSGLGRYDPYYTPIDQQAHSWLAAIRVTGRRATLRLSGSVGFRAEEDSPYFFLSTSAVPQLGLARREFTPWTGRAAADIHAGRRVVVTLQGEAGRGAFYDWLSAAVQLLYRFAPREADTSPSR